MSIIFIDEIVFVDNTQGKEIQYASCLFFLIVNSVSFASGIFFILFYAKVLDYQNNQSKIIYHQL